MATLADNLVHRRAIVEHCYPGVVVYWLGDAAHQAEASDHNPDAVGRVHAIDVMLAVGPNATAVVEWCLAHPEDLEYVIHNRKIYERRHAFNPVAYDGADPHTNHVHISGRHGTAHKDAATGTGYDLEAEKMIPVGSPCTTSQPPAPVVEDQIMDVILPASYGGDGKKTITAEAALSSIMRYVLEARNDALAAVSAVDPDKLAAAIVAKLPTGSSDVAAIKTALAEVLNDATIDVSVPAAG